MILLLDNYDSFTFNLLHYLGEVGLQMGRELDIAVHRNDAITVTDALAMKPEAIVISPGPCTPAEAGISVDIVRAAAEHEIPLLGVCLGHQSIGQAFGGRIIRAPELMHGKTDNIHHMAEGIFRGLPQPFTATRYHSLIVEEDTLPAALEITARTAKEKGALIMGLQHRELPIFGVQFHPESIATEYGHALLKNFLIQAGVLTET
ncbi:aminodeoxychorismate/anthranilate synthase component II [Thermopetrobacter sp. TC1]|uniref:anthranilate synthase component II n=1 Tax=Thermopetrobacter sp. TC1 TaxID=1495045 RepID=UPI0005704CB7|nr:aminodeoxychorismate/anthranilate synthase component II [Thermopetrobacter sp. TC1]